MRIVAITIENFRSIKRETCTFDDLTAIVGTNGAGKSSILRAIELFYGVSSSLSVDDFYNRDTSQNISISVTFNKLSTKAKQIFKDYVSNDTLTIEKSVSWDGGRGRTKYFGLIGRNPDFSVLRESFQLTDRQATAKKHHRALKEQAKYSSLPDWTTKDAVLSDLNAWEIAHPEGCERVRDDGQFFGFNVSNPGSLARFTSILSIPAVHDASAEAIDKGASVVKQLMEMVVRSAVASKQEYITLINDTQKRFDALMAMGNLAELESLEGDLSNKLQVFVRDAGVKLTWLTAAQIQLPIPDVQVQLVEDGFVSDVSKTGHGLQRAFIISLFQQLASASVVKKVIERGEGLDDLPSMLLLIEEPELYQHPARQRHFASILKTLSQTGVPGVAEGNQVVYCTHSPFFVGLDRINQLRLLRKVSVDSALPKQTRIFTTTADALARKVWEADGRRGDEYTGETILPRLSSIMTPWMNEIFFSELVVLVEGENDRAAILGAAKFLGYDLESAGVSVIPCGGKRNLDRPISILKLLQIPMYAVWDNDYGDKDAVAEENRRLLRLFSAAEEDWPNAITQDYACLHGDLESTVTNEIGATEYVSMLERIGRSLGFLKLKHAKKNPIVLSAMLDEAHKQGKASISLQRIVEAFIRRLT